MERQDHRHVTARRQPANGLRNVAQAVTEILAPMGRDADDPPSSEPPLDGGETRCQFRPLRKPTTDPMKRVDHCVAGHVDRCRGDLLAPERLGRGFRRRQMEVCDRADEAAIDLLGPGMVDVAAAQAGLDVRYGNSAVARRHGACERGGGVPLDNDPIWALCIHHARKTFEQASEQLVQCLSGLHQIQVMVRHHARDRQHLIQHPAMLSADADAGDDARVTLECMDQRKQLDGFGPSAEDGQDSARPRHARPHSPLRPSAVKPMLREIGCIPSGASDGARTRDLRRDRPAL